MQDKRALCGRVKMGPIHCFQSSKQSKHPLGPYMWACSMYTGALGGYRVGIVSKVTFLNAFFLLFKRK